MDLQYWGKAFMYAIHIRSVILISGLKDLISYKAQTRCKPDVSHLRIFGLLGQVHIPKQVRKRKLKSRAVKVCLLGWQTDKAKGYQLEDLKNNKLIASQDVQFFEDNSPSDLVTIDISTPTITVTVIDNFVDYALVHGKTKTSGKSSPKSIHNIFPIDVGNASTASDFIRQDDNDTNQILLLHPPDVKKTLKQDLLPKRETFSHAHKLPEQYGLLTIDDILTLGGFANITFIAVTGEPCSLQEVLSSSYLKQWKSAVKSEFLQLQKSGVFEWVDNLPVGKKAIRSCIMFKEKLDRHGKWIKFKAQIVAKGFLQVSGEDFIETFSFVAKFTTLCVFLALATHLDYKIYQVDIVATYL